MFESYRDIQRLASGFQAAKVFLTANDLGLFLALGSGERTAEALAAELEVDRRALELLLNALAGLQMVDKEGERFRNRPVIEEYLGKPESYRGSIFRHIHHCWDSWSRLPEVIRSGQPDFAAEANALGDNDEWTRDFINGMHDVTCELAPQVVPQLGLDSARTLLDVGGGPGTYAAAFLDAWPGLEKVRIFDLPESLAIGRARLEASGLAGKVDFCPGNFDHDPLPAGNDAIWISQVLHSQGEAGCRRLIGNAVANLNPGGRLLVHEFLLDDDKVAPTMATLFAIHMLVMTEQGRTYSGAEIGGWMAEAGLVGMELIRVSPDTAVVVGCKP